jgi:endonuclease/exonuclease/phosphatase family metal-dependent hydrolase
LFYHVYFSIQRFAQDLPCVVWRRHTFSVSETKSKKGVTAALLDMSYRWGQGRHLLFLNTHLDPMNPDSKIAQVRELRQVPTQAAVRTSSWLADFNLLLPFAVSCELLRGDQ